MVNAVLAPRSVYPRWRGEHLFSLDPVAVGIGLSPLARGTLQIVRREVRINRFIPAGAGNTSRVMWFYSLIAVYPRWRGEHCRRGIPDNRGCGLSPLARGTRANGARPPDDRRFIPAGAGNTRAIEWAKENCPVYPRWRGEHCSSAPA